MAKIQRKINSKIGDLYLIASEKGLQGVFWSKQQMKSYDEPTFEGQAILAQAEQEILEYLAGKRKTFSVPLDLQGTKFQKIVWNKLLRIPYGVTKSYKKIAVEINRPNASRAVGTANGKNPICIIIPCHRVIASDGTLGGYSGGLEVKRQLLEMEMEKGR